MYEKHFHFSQTPFSIAPDPAFLYLSPGHQEALAHLMYGFSHGGFVLVTGEVGTGKTTLLRNLMKQTPEKLDVAFILNPRLTVRELLETLCDELGVEYTHRSSLSAKQYIDALNRHLLATHRHGRGTVVIIDEAQNLSAAVLEQIRLLTNLETDKRKLLRIILLGQPELADMLARNELRQLAQRITARYHLGKLSREDTYAYIEHRLVRAGGNPHLFSRPAQRRLYRISEGIPRVINLVADRALLGAYVKGAHRVNAALVNRAAVEVLGRKPSLRRWLPAGLAAATATGMASAYFFIPENTTPAATPIEILAPREAEPEPDGVSASAGPDAAAAFQVPMVGTGSADFNGAGSLPEVAAAAEAAPPEDPGPVPTAATVPERPAIPAFQTQRLAYQALFQQWDADLSAWTDTTIPCDFAPTAGLQCHSRTGSWGDIQRLNLPVVLELWDQSAAPFYAAVTRMTGQEIVLTLGEQRFRVTAADLRDIWFGSFVVLWQMPPDYHGALKRGDRHPSVRWLRIQLESLGAASSGDGDPALFDAPLQDAVVKFQREQQILADGIVGPETWIRLRERLNLPAPKLEG